MFVDFFQELESRRRAGDAARVFDADAGDAVANLAGRRVEEFYYLSRATL